MKVVKSNWLYEFAPGVEPNTPRCGDDCNYSAKRMRVICRHMDVFTDGWP